MLVDGHSYDGPYLVSVDGVGGSAAAVERLGQWRLFNLGQGPQITQIARRTVNLTPSTLATCLSESGLGLCNIEYAGVPRDIGFPLVVTTAGAQASYIANIPFIGVEVIEMTELEDSDPAVDSIVPGQFREVAVLEQHLIARRDDGLVILPVGLGEHTLHDVEIPLETTRGPILALADWPVDDDFDGTAETFNLVVAAEGQKLSVYAIDEAGKRLSEAEFATGSIRLPDGSEPFKLAADRDRKMLYVANGTLGVTVVDFRNPTRSVDENLPTDGVDDRVLGSFGPIGPLALDVVTDVVLSGDKVGHTIAFVAAGKDGWYWVDLGVAGTRMRVSSTRHQFFGFNFLGVLGGGDPLPIVEYATAEVSEIKFFNENPASAYRISVELPGRLADLCDTLPIRASAVARGTDTVVPVPEYPGVFFASSSLDLLLERVPGSGRFEMRRTPEGVPDQFVVASNMPLGELNALLTSDPFSSEMSDLADGASVDFLELYPGNASEITIEVDPGVAGSCVSLAGASLSGLKRRIPVEKLGVIVIAVDGLRQDALYPPGEEQVDESVNYYVDPATLDGFRSILGGGVDHALYSDVHHERICGVSAVYPSITLTSWASIFTGSPPGETGILGNEFFVRSGTAEPVPFQDSRHMITLSEGAFPRTPEQTSNLTPKGVDGFVGDPLEAGQNSVHLLDAIAVSTLYEQLTATEGDSADLAEALRQEFDVFGRDTSVVAQNHWSRGVSKWLTMTGVQQYYVVASLAGDRGVPGFDTVSEALDQIPTTNFADYISSTYTNYAARNDVPFPPLSVLYLAGLDHHAHSPGHGATGDEYRSYLKDDLDARFLSSTVEALKSYQEFYNKIFVVTTDHGHSQISDSGDDEAYPCAHHGNQSNLENVFGRGDGRAKYLERMVDDDDRRPELANQNLQIWELARLIQESFEYQSAYRPRLLLPEDLGDEVDELKGVAMEDGDSADDGVAEATAVAALNGAMAHIYLRPSDSTDWSAMPTEKELGVVAETIRVFLTDGRVAPDPPGSGNFVPTDHPGYDSLSQIEVEELYRNELGFAELKDSVDAILVRKSSGNYEVFKKLAPSTDPEVVQLETAPLSILSAADFVYATERINEMNNLDRSGDLVLILSNRTDQAAVQRYSSGVPCNGWHAGLNRADSYVPLIVSNPGGNHDVVDLVLDTACGNVRTCTGTAATHRCDRSSSLPDIVKTLLESEYLQ